MAIEQRSEKTESSLHKEFQSLLDKDFAKRSAKEGEIIKAKVTEITAKHVVLDASLKAEAMIEKSEFTSKELENLKISDEIEVYLDRLENFKGQVVISRIKAKQMKGWQSVVKLHQEDKICEGVIKTRIKGGMIVEINGFSCFMPSSQLSLSPTKNIEKFFNTPLKFKIIKIDATRGNAICSRRQVLTEDKDIETKELLKEIKEGDIVQARVHACVDWGIFLTYKSLTLLLHVSDLSHGRVKKPSDLVSIGDTIKVKITKIDPKTNRISASVKALTEDPYENIEKKYKVGEIYEGVVSKIVEYGCFIKIEEGIEGLIHSSELDWTNKNIKPSKVLSISQKIKFKIVNIDKASKRISLSYKATLENPWNKVKNLVGKETEIKINNITEKAIFGELIDSKLSLVAFSGISFSTVP